MKMTVNVVILGVLLRVVNDAVPVPKIIVCVKASLEGLELFQTHF